MPHAFSARLDNALLSHGAGTDNNRKEGERQINLLFMIYDLLFLREMCVIRDRLGERYYGRCVLMLGDPPTPFGVGGLNSIALASVPYRHISIFSQ